MIGTGSGKQDAAEAFDYVIVGAGPGGCVLANRLSENPDVRVVLIEAGPPNRHYLIDMPKGFGKLLTGSRFVTHYPTEPDASGQAYVWARGKTLGGSTSVNGMAYTRGQPEDYDEWEAMGATGWGWREMLKAFRAIEDHELGADEMRGVGGPLHVGVNRVRHPVNDAVLEAARAMGLPVRLDNNREDQAGLGPMTHMIKRARRVSAADAFLAPVRHRRNLTVLTDAQVTRVLFDGRRATGVELVRNGRATTLAARREVLLCAGAFETPKLLMLSGIGPAEQLKSHGVSVLHDSPGVGANMAEHRGIALQFALKHKLSHNPQFSGWRLLLNGIRYYLTRGGILSYGGHELMGFAKVVPQSRTADTQMFIAPFSRDLGASRPTFEKSPGAQCLIYPTRPTSRGTVSLRSADPADFPIIVPNALETEYDRHVSVEMVRYVRRLFATPPLADLIARETFPGPQIESDDDILEAIRTKGTWGFHTCGTARMGGDAASVVDPQLRVHGVEGLRVVDASVFPTVPSCNTTAPVAALSWRAADLIRNAA